MPPDVRNVVRIDDDRAVAHVVIGLIRLGSIWIVDIAAGRPRVSWPQTSRGYPIVEVDQPLRGEIEEAVLTALDDDQPARPAVRPRPTSRRSPKKAAPIAAPLISDPLDDIFRGDDP